MNENLEPQELYKRVKTLFGVKNNLEFQPPDEDSPYVAGGKIGTFEVDIPHVSTTEPEDQTEYWLTTPNSTFGGRCPKEYLYGSHDQRTFLASILSSLEDGAFS